MKTVFLKTKMMPSDDQPCRTVVVIGVAWPHQYAVLGRFRAGFRHGSQRWSAHKGDPIVSRRPGPRSPQQEREK